MASNPLKRQSDENDPETVKKPKKQENRAVFASNLPRDTTIDEIHDVFSKQGGIIDESTDGSPRIKMYYDNDGNFTGEALVVYFRSASINQAIRNMDDYPFRFEDYNGPHISVKEADPSFKRVKNADEVASKLSRKDKKASERTRAELNRKLAEWSDNEEEVAQVYAPKKNKWARVCIVKHVFTLKELNDEPEAYLEIKEDMRDEAEQFGEVTNVTLFDEEPAGICTIRFREFDAAEKFRDAIDGRNYAKRKLEVTIAEDRPKFRKSARDREEQDSSDEQRLQKAAEA